MLDILSPELVELVLSHLDRFTLKSCLEVSKIFRDVIIHSPEIMKKLVLRLDDKNWMSKIPFIKSYGMYIRTVEIYCNSQSCMYFQLLHFMPNITKLKVVCYGYKECRPQRSFDSEQNEILLAKMMSLLDSGSDFCGELILKKLEDFRGFFFNVDPTMVLKELKLTKNIKKLCIRSSGNIQYGHGSIVSFLCQQPELTSLELKVARMDLIFSGETIDQMKFKLQCLRLVPSYYAECDYTHLNKFLLTQAECLEELRVFLWGSEDDIFEGISKLKKLKSLTTHGLIPSLRKELENLEEDRAILTSLTHFRYYKGNRNENFDEIDTTSVPNLQCLNVHFGIDHRLFTHKPDINVRDNPLRKLKNLKEFHIESDNQDLLHYLASPNLQKLVIKCEDYLYGIASWTQMARNLPNLQSLTIVEINDEKFLNFIIKNHENYIQKIRKLEILELHYAYEDVLKLYITNGLVTKVVGTCWHTNSILLKKSDVLRKIFEKFDLMMISKDEYEEKYEYMQFYFHSCGP